MTSGSIVFDATDDSLINRANGLDVLRNLSGVTIFIVKKLTNISNSNSQSYYKTYQASANVRVQIYKRYNSGNNNEASAIRRDDSDTSFLSLNPDDASNVSKSIVTMWIDYYNKTVKQYLNGTLKRTDTSAVETAWGSETENSQDTQSWGASIGVAHYINPASPEVDVYVDTAPSDSTIDCVLIVKKALSDEQRQAIENMLLSRYGLAE